MKNAPNPAKKPYVKVSQPSLVPVLPHTFPCSILGVFGLVVLLSSVAELSIVFVGLVVLDAELSVTLVVLVVFGGDVTIVVGVGVDAGVGPTHDVLTSLHAATAVKLKMKLNL